MFTVEKFFNRKFRLPDYSDISYSIKRRLHRINLPNIELGALELVEKVFNLDRNSILYDNSITVQDVKDADDQEIKKYVNKKDFSHTFSKEIFMKSVENVIAKLSVNDFEIKKVLS
jgi:hypothetical protein